MHRVRWFVVVSALSLAFSLFAGNTAGLAEGEEPAASESAASEPGLEEKGAAEVVVPERAAACSLVPTDSPDDEFASCLRVNAHLDRAPLVGETATLTVDVLGQIGFERAMVSVDVPEGLEVVTGAGTSLEATRSSSGIGKVVPRILETGLSADQAVKFTWVLRAVAAGPAPIEVRVSGPIGDSYTDASMDTVFLTVGDEVNPGSLTIEVPTEGGTEEVADAPSAPLVEDASLRVPPADSEAVNDDGQVAAAPQSCVTGRWGYLHPTAGYTGLPNATVQAWDYDTFSADDLLDQDVTDGNGYYTLCWTEVDGEGDDNQEVFLRFRSENSVWRVHNASDNVYGNRAPSSGQIDMPPGTNHNFGTLGPSNNIHRGLHAFHAVNKYWVWGKDPSGPCFDWGDASCRQLRVQWYATSTDGTYYSTSGDEVRLKAADPDNEAVVIHESTHAVMDDVYNDNFPPFPNCNPHNFPVRSSTGCAWIEGFAEWVPAAVLNTPSWGGIETPTWCTGGWDDGHDVEGRVAGAMWDIADSAVAATDYWDYWSESEMSQYGTFQRWATLGNGQRPGTYAEFWQDRSQDGYNTQNTGANAANYQNTIDYSFRDRLTAYAEKTRPDPSCVPNHNYEVVNSSGLNAGYWSVVAIRPASADYDLRYFENSDITGLLGGSTLSGTAVDFVAVDNNHRPMGEFGQWDYPQVSRWLGSGDYVIQWAAAEQRLVDGITYVSMASTDVVHVRDTTHPPSFVPGYTVYYRAVPVTGQDIEIMLMDSDPATPSTWVGGRAGAVASSSAGGAGGAEAFSYDAGLYGDDLGFVLLNTKGSGIVTVYRDTTTPTGSVSINGGDAITKTTTVTLTLSASDPDTGLLDMKVAADGVLDTESWEPYATSKTVTLPGGDGTKTVRVRFRNRALMEGEFSDTITLYTGSLCGGQVPTILGTPGPDTLNGTAGVDVIHGLGGSDTIYGLEGNDRICGGGGADRIYGGPGVDRIYGQGGRDRLYGQGGSDRLYGGAGDDLLDGGGGNDRLYGQAGTDILNGGPGTDACYTGETLSSCEGP